MRPPSPPAHNYQCRASWPTAPRVRQMRRIGEARPVHPRVLILMPMKDAETHIEGYRDLIEALDWPRARRIRGGNRKPKCFLFSSNWLARASTRVRQSPSFCEVRSWLSASMMPIESCARLPNRPSTDPCPGSQSFAVSLPRQRRLRPVYRRRCGGLFGVDPHALDRHRL